MITEEQEGLSIDGASWDQVEADKEALGLIKQFRKLEELPDRIDTSKAKEDLRLKLTKYKDEVDKRGSKPFAAKEEARARIRSEKMRDIMPVFGDLFTDEGFKTALDKLSPGNSYQEMVDLGVDPEIAKSQYRRKLFLSRMAGQTDPMSQGFLGKQLLKLDDPTDENFVAAAGKWVSETNQRTQRIKDSFTEGIQYLKEGKRGQEFLTRMRELKKDDPEMAAAFGKGFKGAVESIKGADDILPYARAFVEGMQDGDVTDGGIGQELVDLYQAGRKDDFWRAVVLLEPEDPEESAGFWNNLGTSFKSGLATIAGDLFNFGRAASGEQIKNELLRHDGKLVVQKDSRDLVYGVPKGLVGSEQFEYATDEELAEKLEGNERNIAVAQVVADLADARGMIRKTKTATDGLWGAIEQGLYDASGSIGYTAMAIVPGGVAGTYMAMAESSRRDLVKSGYDEATASAVSDVVAIPMAGIEFLQGRTIMNVMPGGKSFMKRAQESLMTSMGAKLAAAGAVSGAVNAEYLQETAQEAMVPLATEFMEEISKEVPELNQWDDFKAMDSRRFFAVLPLSLIGVPGSISAQRATERETREFLESEPLLRMDGLVAEETAEVQEALKKSTQAGLEKFREIHNSKTAEERERIGTAALEQYQAEAAGMGDIGLIPVMFPKDGKVILDYRDGREEEFDSMEEASEALEVWQKEEFLNTGEAMKAFAGSMIEKSEGENEVEFGEPRTFEQLAEQGVESREELTKAVQVYYAQRNEQEPDIINLEDYTEDGSVRLLQDLSGFSVRIAEGVNPTVVAEEFSEGFVRRAVALGETSFDDVKRMLDQFGSQAGIEMVQGYDANPDRAVIEGFSKFVKAYALQGDYEGMDPEARTWFKKAWRLMENPANLPGPLKAMAELLSKLFKVVYDVAKAIQSQVQGEGLDADLETLAKRALGLNEQAIAQEKETEYRREIEEDLGLPQSSLLRDSSWIVIDRRTGEFFETFDQSVIEKLNPENGVAISAGQYRGELNRRIKDEGEASVDSEWRKELADFFARRDEDHRKEIEYREEIAESINDPADEIHQKVKGKLPRPKDEAAEGYIGELEVILDHFKTMTKRRGKDGKRMMTSLPSARFFAKTGEGMPLESLMESLNEDGFRFESVSAMLEAIDQSLSGNSQYPIAMGPEMGSKTFSIGNTQVTPNADTRTFPTKDGGLIGPASFSISAFHGTPHKVDRFRTANIGTGEGAQAYGFGLYFAESEDVARSYRALAKWPFPDGDPRNGIATLLATGREDLVKTAYSDFGPESDEFIQARDVVENSSNLYAVTLNVEEDQLLDWDKPLSEQSEEVRKSLNQVFEDEGVIPYPNMEEAMSSWMAESRNAGGFYFNTASRKGEKGASEYLNSVGIKGIRYLDGNSRADGDGSYNYVIFDDADIEITEENGKPVSLKGPTFSISPAQDQAYLKAVESGDMDTAQEMVDEAAKAAGYDVGPVWHGTHRGIFDFFDKNTKARGMLPAVGYFTANKRAAVGYATTGGAGFGPRGTRRDLSKKEDLDYSPKVYRAFLSGNFYSGQKINRESLFQAIQNSNHTDTKGEPAILQFFGISTEEKWDDSEMDFVEGFFFEGADGVFETIDEAVDHWIEKVDDRELDFFIQEDTEAVGGDHPIAALFSDPFVGEEYLRLEGFNGLEYSDKEVQEFADPSDRFDNTTYAPLNPNQIKSADPVTYDADGNVIPLSKRFDETRDEITYAISETAERGQLLEAIDKLFAGPTGLVETGRKLRSRIADIQKRYDQKRFNTDEDNMRELDTLNSLMQLNAIASVLPREVRSAVGSPVPLVELKSLEAKERNLVQRLEKISLALDKHLQDKLRESIRKELDKSGFKVSDSRRRKGKIGKIGHEVVDQIKEVMTKDLDEAEAIKASLTKKFDDIEAPTTEDFERWDSRTLATDLFYDYENATTTRLEQALEFVTTNYKEGRQEWLSTLKKRKEERDQWVAEAISFMGDSDRVYLENLTDAENKSRKTLNRTSEAAAEWIFSNHHTLARIVENAKDKGAAREWYNRLLDSRIQGDMKSEIETDQKQQEFFDKIAEIIGATGVTKGHQVRRFLYDTKRTRKNGITTLEGESRKKVSVDKHLVESLLNREIGGIDGDVFSETDLDALQKQWEKFEDLTEAEQNRVRKIKFDRVVAQGERRPVGDIAQDEALQWWLTMRQPDQREKLEGMGWDARTMRELEEFLPDQVKEAGIWMSDQLVEDGQVLSDIHAEEFGIGLNTGERYFPVRNRVVDQPVEMDMNDPGAGRSISPGSLKERVVNRARPAQVGAFGTYFQHITEMAYWKHNVGWVRQYGGAMRTKAFTENMQAKVGAGAVRTLQKYLGAVQNRGVNAGRQMLGFERLIKSMISRMSLAILGARVSTMWVNATAFVNAFASSDVSAASVLKNMFKMGFDSKGELKATWRNELALMRRKLGASFEAQMAMKSGRAGHWLIQDSEKLAQKGLVPMNNIDVAANTLTMAAIYRTHYDAAIKRGEGEESARQYADEGVTRAHAVLAQPSLAVSRSQAEMATSQNPFLGIFTMFMSEVRKNAANNYMAWRTLFTGKGLVDRPTAARQAFVYTIVYTGVVQAFRGFMGSLLGGDDEDEEIEAQLRDPKFWTYAIAADNLGPVPLFGDAALSLMAKPLEQKYWEQRTPFARIAGQAKQVGRIFDEKASDSERVDEVIDQMQTWGSVLPGGPLMAEAANLGQFAKDVYEGGMGMDLSEDDQIGRIRREISQNKADIYEKHEDQETRWDLLRDVLNQYREENSDLWPKIESQLKEKKTVPKSVLE